MLLWFAMTGLIGIFAFGCGFLFARMHYGMIERELRLRANEAECRTWYAEVRLAMLQSLARRRAEQAEWPEYLE